MSGDDHPLHWSPMERRRAEIEKEMGSDPAQFTPDILRRLANGPIYDVERHYCPAGKLSLEEAKKRERKVILSNKNGAT